MPMVKNVQIAMIIPVKYILFYNLFILLLAIRFAFAWDASDSLPFRYCSMISPAIGAARSAPNPPCST